MDDATPAVRPARPVIRLLPETTANRIAAGEVVERPAAAVKELVENALDAGARRIQVILEQGGIGRILVEDDGCGMTAADLAMAIQRHATSKLPLEAALFRIATLGFRGEALPSIGAVSRLAITSCPPDGEGHRIAVEAGSVAEVMPAAAARGTRVEVRDLFFATPARRKFLRSPRVEADHAIEAVKRLAIAWPEVAFRVEVDGREALLLQATDRDTRIRQILGPEFAGAALAVDHVSALLSLSGLAAQPAYSRPTTAGQHLVVNRRPVRDPMLRIALGVAYRDVMERGRHPAAALFLDLPPEAVDVNVHPMKTEIRFREAEAVRGTIISALRRTLGVGAAAAVPAAGFPRGPASRPVPGFAEAPLVLSPPSALGGPLQPGLGLSVRPAIPVAVPAIQEAATHPLGRAIAQLLDTYVLAEAADGSLVLVDQHAAHERLTHEALLAEHVAGGVRTQPLLLPAVVEMAPDEAARLLDAAEALARFGLEIEGFGGGAVLVRGLPALLGNPDPAPLLRDLAEELADGQGPAALADRVDAAIARMACHGSVRAGRRLAPAEMDALLRALEATPRAATCSHGRPTVLKLDRVGLERLFGRR